jgi:predicted amidohydrolase
VRPDQKPPLQEIVIKRRKFLAVGMGSLLAASTWERTVAATNASPVSAGPRTIRVALIQFDAVPERVEFNLQQMSRLTKKAAADGAQWILFHEGTVCDYTARLGELAEEVPAGRSTQFMIGLARETGVFISFGLSERDQDRFHITQVFVGPKGFLHRYRKTWLWYMPDSRAGEWVGGHRDEWERYDPGTGPELFDFDGLRAACFICADGNSRRCLERIKALRPQVVFYPNNRSSLGDPKAYAEQAKRIAAPLLVPNRVGKSWVRECDGGSIIYDRDGKVLARANRNGREEILLHDLSLT